MLAFLFGIGVRTPGTYTSLHSKGETATHGRAHPGFYSRKEDAVTPDDHDFWLHHSMIEKLWAENLMQESANSNEKINHPSTNEKEEEGSGEEKHSNRTFTNPFGIGKPTPPGIMHLLTGIPPNEMTKQSPANEKNEERSNEEKDDDHSKKTKPSPLRSKRSSRNN